MLRNEASFTLPKVIIVEDSSAMPQNEKRKGECICLNQLLNQYSIFIAFFRNACDGYWEEKS